MSTVYRVSTLKILLVDPQSNNINKLLFIVSSFCGRTQIVFFFYNFQFTEGLFSRNYFEIGTYY